MPFVIVNFIAMQATWFACVLGGAGQLPWIGVGTALLVVLLHLKLSPQIRPELSLLVLVGLIGSSWEALVMQTGWLVYPSGIIIAGTAPIWIMALWVAFATSLNVSMRWLKGRYLLAAALGAVVAPMSFLAGARLGGVEFVEPVAGLAMLSIGWAMLLPTVVRIGEHFDGWPKAIPERAASR